MSTFLIGYDLNKPEQDYPELINAIETSFGKWWHYLDSTWLIKSDLSATDIRDKLKPHIDSDDELLVVRLSGEGAWAGFSSEASDWLQENL